MKIIIGTLLMLCHFGLNETSPISTNEVTNKSLIQVDHDQQCPENWLLLDDKCFRISSEEATFDEAVTKCKDEGSNLFEPQADIENQQVYELLSNHSICDEYFIGIKADEDGM